MKVDHHELPAPGACPGQEITTAADGTATLKITSTGTGDTTISATATDKVGNTSTPVTTPIDRTAPSVTIVGDPGRLDQRGQRRRHHHRDRHRVRRRIDQPDLHADAVHRRRAVRPRANGSATMKLQATADGVTTISATATDNASNTSPAVTATASIDRTAPTASLSASGDTNSDGFYGAGEPPRSRSPAAIRPDQASPRRSREVPTPRRHDRRRLDDHRNGHPLPDPGHADRNEVLHGQRNGQRHNTSTTAPPRPSASTGRRRTFPRSS